MAVELGPDDIRVNAICPVMGETGMFTQFMGMPDTPENRAKFLGSIPLGRFFIAQRCGRSCFVFGQPRSGFFYRH
jgi:3-oxoacyl-[acyl-carrier protein] reductase